MKAFNIILLVVLLLLFLAISSVVISDCSVIIAKLGGHIMDLFSRADLRPKNHGFSSFVQLILIACFIGWTIGRFKRK